MVTADEALGEIKDLCNMFGFDFSRHFMAENIKRKDGFLEKIYVLIWKIKNQLNT